MFHELREYDLELSKVGTFLQLYEEFAIPALADCGFDMVGAWVQDIGPSTATTFVWLARWETLDARTAALQKTRESPDYLAFGEKVRGIVRRIDTRILRNVSFSPLLAAPGPAGQPSS
jgi:NIPSNAP protein